MSAKPATVIRRFDVVNLIAMRNALDRHNAACSKRANAIHLNPIDHGLLRWEALWGLPLVADDDVRVKYFKIECDGAPQAAEQSLLDDDDG
jgi:hypothetical protein